MNIKEIQDKEHYPSYIIEATAGEVIALWRPLESERITSKLSPVEYDCWKF